MRPTRRNRDRAERDGHHLELWSRRPLATWNKTAANKRLSMRLWRRRMKREMETTHAD